MPTKIDTIRQAAVATLMLLCSCFAAQAETSGNRALLIGVRNYDPDQLVAIPAAETEVTRLSESLMKGGFDAQHITLMTNGAGARNPQLLPTAANIMRELDTITKGMGREDTLVIAFSGHGVASSDGAYRICPIDADLEDHNSLLPIQDFFKALKSCGSRRKLLLVDAMRSYPFADGLDPTLVDSCGTRMPSLPSLPSGTAALVSCGHGQATDRIVLARTGTFFDAVNKGMQGAAAGQDGSVTLPDLERYVKQQFASSAFQPVLLSNTTGLFTILTHSLGADDMEQIQKLIRGDRYEEALTIVNSRLATDPDDGTALAQKARLISYQAEQFRRYSRMHEALEAAEKAVRLAPNEALPYVARANVFRIQKKYEKSFADATAAVRCDPNCVMAHVIRGFALHHLHDLEGMGREAKLGMDIAPEHPEARATYVAYLFAKGRLDEGHSQLDRAIAITPDMPALYFLKGYGFEKQGKHLAAVAQYDQAITLNNQIPSYLCRRAISHSNSGNHNAAMADVAAAEAVDPEYFDIASVRAMVIQKQRGYGQSEQAIADGLKKNPKSADLWYGRGFNFLNSGRYAEAIKSFEQALEINPGYGEVHMGIGMVYAKQNRWDDALVHLNRATRHKEHLTRAYFEKCQVYIGKRDYASALRELDKAMGYEPRNSVFVQQRQQLLMMQGR